MGNAGSVIIMGLFAGQKVGSGVQGRDPAKVDQGLANCQVPESKYSANRWKVTVFPPLRTLPRMVCGLSPPLGGASKYRILVH